MGIIGSLTRWAGPCLLTTMYLAVYQNLRCYLSLDVMHPSTQNTSAREIYDIANIICDVSKYVEKCDILYS